MIINFIPITMILIIIIITIPVIMIFIIIILDPPNQPVMTCR